MEFVTQLLSLVMAGLIRSSVLILLVIGLALTFGVLDIVNFAHGELATLGAYSGLFVVYLLGSNVGYFIALLVVPLFIAVVSVGMEQVSFKKIEGRDPLYYILLTFGIGIIIREAIIMFVGANGLKFPIPELLNFAVFGYPFYRVFILSSAVVLSLGFFGVTRYTQFGRAVRAVAHDPDVASMMGVNSDRVKTKAFALGAAIAGIGGVLAGPIYGAYPFLGFDLIIIAFVAIVAGGMGSIRGSIIAAFLFGQLLTIPSIWIPIQWTITIPFLITVAILVVLPGGIEEVLP
jgi:branched-chain amino acid transport system permease protein